MTPPSHPPSAPPSLNNGDGSPAAPSPRPPKTSHSDTSAQSVWLVRLGDVFAPFADHLRNTLGEQGGFTCAPTAQPLGGELQLLTFAGPIDLTITPASCFFRWMIPVTHRWPVNPSKSDGFVEKAAQGLARSFASARPADVLVASSASDPQSRALASNVRGRCVQVFSAQSLPLRPAETPLDEVSPDKTIVFALITSKGLLAGLASPRRARSFYPTGVRFVRQTSEDVVSRAGAKLVDGLSLLRLFGTPCAPRAHWLELGASPGGMTAELLRRGQRVTALDRPALSPSLEKAPGLTFLQRDVASFTPEKNDRYDAILCDMNGPWTISFAEVSRLAPFLTPGAPCLYTLKFNELRVPADVLSALEDLDSKAKAAGLQKLIATHSAHNRNELTILLKKE